MTVWVLTWRPVRVACVLAVATTPEACMVVAQHRTKGPRLSWVRAEFDGHVWYMIPDDPDPNGFEIAEYEVIGS